MKQGKQHDNMKMRGDKIPNSKGERGKIPLFPNKVSKKERDDGHNSSFGSKTAQHLFYSDF